MRYSEDIDFIQTKAYPIGPLFDRIKEQLSFLGEPQRKQKNRNSVLLYRFDSEIPPITPLKLKIEINCREHFAVFGVQQKSFQVRSPWFSGQAPVTTFTLEELLGSKLRALYQRKKGRDLFDLWYAISQHELNSDQIITSFHKFMEASGATVARQQFETNLQRKIHDRDFLGDTTALLRPEIAYNPNSAYQHLMEHLISKLD